MKRFHFNLERILQIRKHYERQEEIKLAQAVSRCLELENRIRKNGEDIRAMFAKRGSYQNNIGSFYGNELYIQRLRLDSRKCKVELVEAEKTREQARKVFIEASRKRKVLTRLREREESEYYDENKKAETKEADDMSNTAQTAKRMHG